MIAISGRKPAPRRQGGEDGRAAANTRRRRSRRRRPAADRRRRGSGQLPAPPTAAAPSPARRPGTLPAVPWALSQTFWLMIGGFVLAAAQPGVGAPLRPRPRQRWRGCWPPRGCSSSRSSSLRSGSLRSGALGRSAPALGRSGLRRAVPKDFGLALLTLLVYYIVAALFASLVLQPEQEDIARRARGRGPESPDRDLGGSGDRGGGAGHRGALLPRLRLRRPSLALPLWPAALSSA